MRAAIHLILIILTSIPKISLKTRVQINNKILQKEARHVKLKLRDIAKKSCVCLKTTIQAMLVIVRNMLHEVTSARPTILQQTGPLAASLHLG